MTEKLYDISAYQTKFEATVLSCQPLDNGYAVLLDRTLFFPEEGGQKCDKGILSDANVYDVQITSDENIIHYTDKPLNGKVQGEIDFDRRFRNMQHHTGEHILSGLIFKHFGLNNVGFHLSDDDATIDTEGPLSEEQLKFIETEANKAIYKNIKVEAFFPSVDELNTLSYRSKKELSGKVRIVNIEGCDTCACCAPHVAFTGEIGIIKILDYAVHKNGLRIHYKCGLDAISDYGTKYQNIKQISALLAAPQNSTAAAVKKLAEENKALSRTLGELKRAAALKTVEEIAKTSENLCLFFDQIDIEDLRAVANAAKNKCDKIIAAFCGNDTSGYRYIIVSNNIDLKPICAPLNSALGGKGGGSSLMLQGSLCATKSQIESYIKAIQTTR